MIEEYRDGALVRRVDSDGVWSGNPLTLERPLTPREAAQVAAADQQATFAAAQSATRTALSDALNLAALYPAPSPEENSMIKNQISAALEQFRSLEDPPIDIIKLASALVSWKVDI